MKKRILSIFLACFALVGLGSCKPKDPIDEPKVISVIFEGADTLTVEEGKVITLPDLTLNAGEELLGWALRANEEEALFTDEATYDEISDYSSNGSLKLYPVIDYSVEVTMIGVTEVKTTVSKIRKNKANLPIVEQSERQKFNGWATTQNAVAAQLPTDAIINYDAVKDLATNAKVTLYPVIESYDIMICVHGSHSNGNIYISDAQRIELKALLEEHFVGKNILIDYVDLANAATFATEAIKKDYDILLTSKTARDVGETAGDIKVAALNANKPYYAEADANETILQTIDINQSRQVCRMLGSNNEKPLQNEVYNFLTTPLDKTVTVKFINGDLNETIEAHRVVDGSINTVPYLPSEESAIAVKEGFTLVGWRNMGIDGDTTVYPNVTFAIAEGLAVDGIATFCPVFEKLDLVVYVWCGQSKTGTTYVTEDEVEAIKQAFITSIGEAANGKNIVFKPVWGQTAKYATSVGSDADVIISGQNLNTAEQCAHLLIPEMSKYLVINAPITNKTRYAGLCTKAANNELANALLRSLCEATVNVTFKYGDITSEQITVSSMDGNTAVMPETIVAPDGTFLTGYALTNTATEAVITGDVNYLSVKDLAVEGAITLYPVFASYDLVVYIWAVNGTNIYASEQELADLEAGFKTYLGAAANGLKLKFNPVSGATASYAANIGADADVVLSGKNINTQVTGLATGLDKFECINFTFSSTRYAGIKEKAKESELAISLVKYLCEDSISVTFAGTQAQTLNLIFNDNELVVPEVNVPEGKTFAGWATTETASIAEFTTATLTFAALSAKATNKAITLYPVFIDAQVEPTHYDVVIAYHAYGATTGTPYFTEAQVEAAKGLITAALTDAGYKAEDYTITWVLVSGKVANCATAIKNLETKADVAIAHTQCFDPAKTADYFVCASACPGTVFTNKTAGDPWFCDSNLKVGVAETSATNPIAVIIYNTLIALAK